METGSARAIANDSCFSWGRTSRNQPTKPQSAKIAPSKLTNSVVTNPANNSATPKARTMGHGVLAGISIVSLSSDFASGGFASGNASGGSNFQSGSSGCFTSQSGRRLLTAGSDAKLYTGGGELVDHSSVQASQGSFPAIFPLK